MQNEAAPLLVRSSTFLIQAEEVVEANRQMTHEATSPLLLHYRRGLERLLRRLVAHPDQPGILYVHYWPAARFHPPFMNGEELIDTVLKHYGIPTLSMKSAVHQLLSEQPQLLDQLWWPAPDAKIHPTCIGARSAFPAPTSLPLLKETSLALTITSLLNEDWQS